jgi:hypothetical protein
MLGGIDPIIIFQFSKLLDDWSDTVKSIPIISKIPTVIDEPPIPIYLSERLTGILIESEEKNIDIETSVETLEDGSEPDISQKAILSVVTINMKGSKDSVGLMLIAAFAEQILKKVTSREYAISYLNGSTTVLRGLLHSFSVSQESNTDLMRIKLELTKGKQETQPKSGVPVVEGAAEPVADLT